MTVAPRAIMRRIIVGWLCLCAWPSAAAENTAIDPDTVPRAVGGGNGRVLGGDASLLVIPYALPKGPTNAAPKRTPAGAPDLSGTYWHEARVFQNPAASVGVGPGLATAPTALTLYLDERTDSLGSRGDYTSPVLRPWAAELVKQFGDAEHASQPWYELCLQNNGVLVQWSLGNRGLRLVQTPSRIYLFFGRDVVRVVDLNAKHPANLKPSINGHSAGHWEGDALVIDTVGFDGTAYADRYGTPTSEELHVVERMHLRQGGELLEVNFRVDDPVVFTQPWTSVVTYPRVKKVAGERLCREAHIFRTVRHGT